jgi:hypothetical protein
MTAIIRVAESMMAEMRMDLARPHGHAAERVGFLFGPHMDTTAGTLLLPTAYVPVKDDDYINDRFVGARISSRAIRSAMQRVLETGESCLHVHVHEHRGRTGPSGVDLESTRRLSPSFHVVAPGTRHGALILSLDRAWGTVWCAERRQLETARVMSVGLALQLDLEVARA